MIEIVDADARLRSFVSDLSDVPGIGLMTLEMVEVLGREFPIDPIGPEQ